MLNPGCLQSLNDTFQSTLTSGACIVEPIEVEALIKKELQDAEVIVDGEGCSFSVIVVSNEFDGRTLLKKQQMVLDSLKEPLATGELHAITVKTYTPDEWADR